MQRPLQDILFTCLSCHSNAQLLADSFRASSIQSWSWYHYYPQRALPTQKNKQKVWKTGSTSSKTYFWDQYHVLFHSFQHILHAACKQLNNHQLICSTNLQMSQSLTAISLPSGWLFLPSPRLWLLSRPPRCQIPWPFWVLWQPAPGTLLSMHSTFGAGRQIVIFACFLAH